MTTIHSIPPPTPRTDPFRWSRADAAQARDSFQSSAAVSQRQYAKEQGIPRSTLGSWLRQDDLEGLDSQLVAFLRSTSGEAFLRSLVVAALVTFGQRGACGLRLVSDFLRLSRLDHFVAASRGALHSFTVQLEAELGAFDDEQRPRLAEQMQPKTITLTADENFHGLQPCLVALEPVSNFLVVECYRDGRDAATWTQAIKEGLDGMPVEVVLLTSDQARGLLCCATKGLQVAHQPDLFHLQRDLLGPLMGPLARPIQQANKELKQARQHGDSLPASARVLPDDGPPLSVPEVLEVAAAVRQELKAEHTLAEALQQKEAVLQPVRGLGDDYHPFDANTGQPLSAAQVQERLQAQLEQLEQAVPPSQRNARAQEAITKARTWVGTLAACVAWFWGLTQQGVEELDLSVEQERVVVACLVSAAYWEQAARRARQAPERQRLAALAQRLHKEAWHKGGVLASLSKEQKQAVQRVAQQCAGLFRRSSSCVEGRNGRLSLHHHGHGGLSARKLKALTVIHNYLVQREDGTTAAQRFFGAQHPNVFDWLLQRLPDLPRPAAKRPKKAG